MSVKQTRKLSGLVIYAFTAVRGVPFVNKRYIRFSLKNDIYKGKGLDLGQSFPVLSFSCPLNISCLSLASFSLSLSKTVFYFTT